MPSASQNPIPWRIMNGRIRNIGKDGSTYQNVALAWLANRSVSPVSCHSQIIASTDTRGSDAINPPSVGLRLDVSAITSTMMPDINALRIRNGMTRTVQRKSKRGHHAPVHTLRQPHQAQAAVSSLTPPPGTRMLAIVSSRSACAGFTPFGRLMLLKWNDVPRSAVARSISR